MKLLRLLFMEHVPESRDMARFAMLMALIDALAALLLIHSAYSILQGAQQVPASFLFTFITLLLIGSLVRNTFGSLTAACGAAVVTQLRLDLLKKVVSVELDGVEQVGIAAIIEEALREGARIQSAIQVISRFIYTVAAGILLVLYFVWLSPLAVLITMTLTLLVGTVLAFNLGRDEAAHKRLARKEMRYQRAVSDLVFGIETLALDKRKASVVCEEGIRAPLIDWVHAQIAPWSGQVLNVTLTGIGPLMTATSMILLFPWLTRSSPETVIGTLLTLCWIPLIAAVHGIPSLLRGEAALERIDQLMGRLGQVHEFENEPSIEWDARSILQMESTTYHYTDQDGRPTFILGPLSLSLKGGTLTIITGPNGSGKSTLLKLLTGLYRPHEGVLLINGEPIAPSQYRRIFCGIVANHGKRGDSYSEWEALCVNAAITSFPKGPVMPSAPILVLDKPETELDFAFLDRLYFEIVPFVKAQGRSLVIVSQYERYFHCADQLIRLDYGKIVA